MVFELTGHHDRCDLLSFAKFAEVDCTTALTLGQRAVHTSKLSFVVQLLNVALTMPAVYGAKPSKLFTKRFAGDRIERR
jgi:hypothetical protein